MTDEKKLLDKFKEEIQIVRKNNNEREGYIINSGSLKAICITPMRNYGGGSRALWAIEGVEAQLTVNRAYPYIHGVCLKIYDEDLSFDFKPIKGKWFDNDYDWDNTSNKKEVRRLRIREIGRYDRGHLY